GAPPNNNRTSGEGGILSGNQVNPYANAPVTVCGNAVAVIGKAVAGCGFHSPSGPPSGGNNNSTSGDGGIRSGNQVNPVVNAPVTVCGNAVAVIGRAVAWCDGHTPSTPPGGGNNTGGDNGTGSGNQINPVVDTPVTVCGNALAVLG